MNIALTPELLERAREKTMELITQKCRVREGSTLDDVRAIVSVVQTLINDADKLDRLLGDDRQPVFPGLRHWEERN